MEMSRGELLSDLAKKLVWMEMSRGEHIGSSQTGVDEMSRGELLSIFTKLVSMEINLRERVICIFTKLVSMEMSQGEYSGIKPVSLETPVL
ncbi:hypothetical protein AVEN_204694-1 [Araneus ventricosus]|uniref:Uncharacterized protein n=1 Tax=Araneus ventricosus TaxID=182803 RepID=A0A4Y2GJ22_ARAVE|nr:hypothetical protein AVEN_204694-1 [Araneus ventricosus]